MAGFLPALGVIKPIASGGSAPVMVQATSTQVTNATTIAYTFGSAPTAGNTLYVFVTGRSAVPSTTPPTGWTFVNAITPDTPFGGVAIFSKVSDGSETTASFSVPGTPVYLSIAACEVSGTSGINAQQWNTIGNVYTAPPYDFGPCTPTTGNCLALAFTSVGTTSANAYTSVTATAGWTINTSQLHLYCSLATCWQNCGASGTPMDGSTTFSGGSTQAKHIVAGMLILHP